MKEIGQSLDFLDWCHKIYYTRKHSKREMVIRYLSGEPLDFLTSGPILKKAPRTPYETCKFGKYHNGKPFGNMKTECQKSVFLPL